MSSNTYTIDELLHLRGHGIAMSLPNAPQKGRDQVNGSVNQSSMRDTRTIGRNHRHRPHLSLHSITFGAKNDISATSDDTVFRRQQVHRESVGSISADTEWKYHDRTESEVAASMEPLSAPTGLSAQKSEGFQRFYKAVISPSHVRVTAGGRIVPNTRGTSPMSKRLKDKTESGSQSSSGQTARQQTQQPESHFQQAPKAPAVPMFALPTHQFYPPYSASVPQIPMVPMPMGVTLPGGFHYPQHMSVPRNAVPISHTNHPKSSTKENLSGSSDSEASEPRTVGGEKATEKAPGDHFDHTKPFVINGQLMYPFPGPGFTQQIAPGSQPHYMPPGFVGHSGFPVASFPNTMMATPVSMNHMYAAPMGYHAFQGSPQMPPSIVNLNGPQQTVPIAVRQPSAGTLRPPPAPPISSIRPSDISRKQIELLRNSLKYHEDQLQYNKHQIDEKEMERTITMLQSQIDRFETLNKSQLMFEDMHYPKKETKVDDGLCQTSHIAEKKLSVDAGSQTSSKQGLGSSKIPGNIRPQHLAAVAKKTDAPFNFDPVESPTQFSDPVKKSTLPSGAALAPPFEPRSVMSGARDRSQNSHSLRDNGVRNNASGNATDSNQRSDMFSVAPEKPTNLGKPYLVGMPPKDVNSRGARDSDLMYERELNEDEIRARYLYWGKAPPFTRKGLPKFDGKDFYRPSPTRESSDGDSTRNLPRRSIPIMNPNIGYGLEAVSKPTESMHTVSLEVPVHSFLERPRKGVNVTLKRPKNVDATKLQRDGGQSSKAAGVNWGESDGKHHAKTSALPNVLRRNISGNSDVLPSSFSSETAQGILPQYSSGYKSLLAASLSPVVPSPNAGVPPSPIKSDDGCTFVTPSSRKIGENRPPPDDVGPASLETKFRNIVSLESKQTAAFPVHWGS